MTCAACGEPAEGHCSIHRDGFGEGPEVELCDACGMQEDPSCETLWARIRERAAVSHSSTVPGDI